MSRRVEDLDPKMQSLAAEFLRLAWAAGLPVVITQTRRSAEEQGALYAQGRTTPGRIVTLAQADGSPHCAGLAVDVAFRCPSDAASASAPPHPSAPAVTWDEPRPGAWDELGAIGISLGLVWGGQWRHFQDRPHFQLEDWRIVAKQQPGSRFTVQGSEV